MKLFTLITLVLTLSCSSAPAHSKAQKLTILHTNDHHGRFWENKDGEYGLAARATLIAKLRQEVKESGGETLLLDAGDVNTGVPQSDMLNAEPDFRGMAAIGYDVMAVGNHEFDNPLSVILKQQKKWAKFPFISANIYNKKTGRRVFPASITKKVNNLRVTIFGLTTEDTPKKSNPKNTENLRFIPAVEEAKKLVPKLRPKSDVLIALTHTGHDPDGKHGADAPGDVTIARSVKGIDLIVGGHSQKPLFEADIQNGTIIVQAYEWGKYVGKIDLEVEDGKVNLKSYKLIPVNLKDSANYIEPNQAMLSLLKPFKDLGDQTLAVEIGKADQEFIGRREVVRGEETNLGNLISRAYKEKFSADLAIANSGGIRDSIYPGKITMETILMVLPFGGEIVTAELTGLELKKYIETVVTTLTPGSGSFPQMNGVKIVVDRSTNKLKSLHVNDELVLDSKKYVLALPEFIALGGDKYPALVHQKYGYVDANILKEFVQHHKEIHAADYTPTGYIKFE